MMRHIFFIVTMILTCNILCSQEELREKNNLVFLEFLGSAYEGAGIGYERYFRLNKLFRYSLRGGLSYDLQFKYVTLFMGNSLMFGKRHNIEMGLNYMRKYPERVEVHNSEFNPGKEMGPDNSSNEEIVERRDIFNFLLGYRYQNERSGFMVRSFIGAPIKRNQYLVPSPHLGFSVGLSF